jgi:hypothetical protein
MDPMMIATAILFSLIGIWGVTGLWRIVRQHCEDLQTMCDQVDIIFHCMGLCKQCSDDNAILVSIPGDLVDEALRENANEVKSWDQGE